MLPHPPVCNDKGDDIPGAIMLPDIAPSTPASTAHRFTLSPDTPHSPLVHMYPVDIRVQT